MCIIHPSLPITHPHTFNTPVQCKAPSWSSTSSGLTAYKHSLSEAKHVGGPCWMHLNLEVWNTHRHWHRNTGWSPCSSGPTCYIQCDGVGGGPSPQWLVCLKPEVILACITQLHNSYLDWAAGITAPDVAGTHDSFVIHHFTFTVRQLEHVSFSYRVRPRYNKLIWFGSVWWANSLWPFAETRNHMTRFTVWPVKTTAKLHIQTHSKF